MDLKETLAGIKTWMEIVDGRLERLANPEDSQQVVPDETGRVEHHLPTDAEIAAAAERADAEREAAEREEMERNARADAERDRADAERDRADAERDRADADRVRQVEQLQRITTAAETSGFLTLPRLPIGERNRRQKATSIMRDRIAAIHDDVKQAGIADSHAHVITGIDIDRSGGTEIISVGGMCYPTLAHALSKIPDSTDYVKPGVLHALVAVGHNDEHHKRQHFPDHLSIHLRAIEHHLRRCFPNARIDFLLPFTGHPTMQQSTVERLSTVMREAIPDCRQLRQKSMKGRFSKLPHNDVHLDGIGSRLYTLQIQKLLVPKEHHTTLNVAPAGADKSRYQQNRNRWKGAPRYLYSSSGGSAPPRWGGNLSHPQTEPPRRNNYDGPVNPPSQPQSDNSSSGGSAPSRWGGKLSHPLTGPPRRYDYDGPVNPTSQLQNDYRRPSSNQLSSDEMHVLSALVKLLAPRSDPDRRSRTTELSY